MISNAYGSNRNIGGAYASAEESTNGPRGRYAISVLLELFYMLRHDFLECGPHLQPHGE